MRKALYILWIGMVVALMSCSEPKKDMAAANAAKEFYDSLVARNVSFFVRGTYLADTIPDGYREQLEASAKMLLARIGELHHGVNGVTVVDCINDTVNADGNKAGIRVADAFLMLNFNDSTNEEIVVPMILHKGKWLMR